MKRYTFKTMRSRLTFWFLLLTLIPLLTALSITYFQRIRAIRAASFDKLTAIRDLKMNELHNWLDRNRGDMKILASDQELGNLKRLASGTATLQEQKQIKITSRYLLKLHIQNHQDHSEIDILHPQSGEILVSTNEYKEGENRSGETYFLESLQRRELYLQDIYHSNELSSFVMTYAIPIFSTEPAGENLIAILVAHLDLHNSLYKSLLSRVGLGKSGETLIVDRTGLALNELRWQSNAPLNLQITAAPAINAAQGKAGIIMAQDYRGIDVLAAYAHIPETGWGFVCKQDLDELNTPVREMIRDFAVIFLLTGSGSLLFALLLGRSISRPIVDMNRHSRRIQAGDFTVRNTIDLQDELGSLAQTFNKMAETTAEVIDTQRGVMAVSGALAGLSTRQSFSAALLQELMPATGCDLGVFYALSGDDKEFEPLAFIGADAGYLPRFRATQAEGELGLALLRKEIHYLQNIPPDTPFHFKTSAGQAVPREIGIMPVLTGDTVAAFVSLVNLNNFTATGRAILEQAWLNINAAYTGLLAAEKTRALAENLQASNSQLEAQSRELQSQTIELQAMNNESQQQSEELLKQNTELEFQRRQIEEANRLKSEFLSNMSHELRTPLNSVMALSRILILQAAEKLSNEEAGYLKIIERNGKRLLDLINDILDLSKIEAGKMEVHLKEFALSGAVDAICESLKPLAESKGISILSQTAADFPRIESDESRLLQILQNLIGNGVKFTEQGSVRVHLSYNTDNVQIEVADTGIGIVDKDLPYIFDEFRQVDGSTSRKYEGTGLGLTITYKAVQLLQGQISVESQPGKGTTFRITLPRSWPGKIPAVADLTPVLLPEAPAEHEKTILVVDDEPEMAAKIAAYLSAAGYNVITAYSGREAVNLTLVHHPYAVTLDVNMPGLDGWEVLQNLKKNPLTRDIPVLIVSIAEDNETGLALGAVGCLTKPFASHELLYEIHKIGKKDADTVLVVDDNSLDLKTATRYITQAGIRVLTASNGTDCLQLLTTMVPDVLLLDLMMPEMDGFEVLERIRANPSTKNLPVVISTAKELTEADRRKLSGNAAAIITKSAGSTANLLKELTVLLMQLGAPAGGQPTRPGSDGTRLLVVEDNEAAMIQVLDALKQEGYQIDVACNGQQALTYINANIPDGIILDLMMPDIDGFQVLESLRNTPATAQLPVLVLTAKDLTREDLQKLTANHISQLLIKGDIDRTELIRKTRIMLGRQPAQRTTPAPQSTPPSVVRRKPRPQPVILIIEDNQDNMLTCRASLGEVYCIIETYDGKKGLETALTQLPDLILMDISLPLLDGFALVGRLKADPRVAGIPVIALTARAMRGDREALLAAGCDDYISKPVDPEQLAKTVANWIERLRKDGIAW